MSKRKENKINILFIILAIVFLIISTMFFAAIKSMNLLPSKYIIVFAIIETLITGLLMFGMIKERKDIGINVACLVIAILFSVGYGVAINYANATNNFIDDMFQKGIETESYYVVVNKDSSFKDIKELNGKELYLFQTEEDIEEKVKSKVELKIKRASSLDKLGKDLLDKKEVAILVSSFQYNILDEEIEDFKNQTKIIFTVEHKIENEEAVIEDKDTKHNIANGIFNIYISGIDTRGKITNVGRSDANIVVSVNMKTHEVLLTSIPRDYYVPLHSKKDLGKRAFDKLTHSGVYGITETITTVEDLLDIDINYYVRVNFSTVEKVVNALGGVDVNSEYSFKSDDGYYYKKGINHLNGKEALSFSRERNAFKAGDNQRIKNQQSVINAIMDKAMSPTILNKYASILESLKGTFQTNVSPEEIRSLVQMQLNEMPSWNITKNTLEGTPGSEGTYSYGSQKLYVTIQDEASVQKAKDMINNIINK